MLQLFPRASGNTSINSHNIQLELKSIQSYLSEKDSKATVGHFPLVYFGGSRTVHHPKQERKHEHGTRHHRESVTESEKKLRKSSDDTLGLSEFQQHPNYTL
ncbi:hypothetical protein AVEN_53373-1 [Araneus ventricosus]|uniref:Uncharacterized protein n=1 Tax=Araneus ventricosus TaxID=182803 RepID=A0A4Y2AA17_ARAVE|nr:hypothetical protein AVEN_53373-1 [Araneus ventricosus]